MEAVTSPTASIHGCNHSADSSGIAWRRAGGLWYITWQYTSSFFFNDATSRDMKETNECWTLLIGKAYRASIKDLQGTTMALSTGDILPACGAPWQAKSNFRPNWETKNHAWSFNCKMQEHMYRYWGLIQHRVYLLKGDVILAVWR